MTISPPPRQYPGADPAGSVLCGMKRAYILKHLPPQRGKEKKPLTGRGFRALSCITDDTAVLRNQSRRFFSPILNQRRSNTV